MRTVYSRVLFLNAGRPSLSRMKMLNLHGCKFPKTVVKSILALFIFSLTVWQGCGRKESSMPDLVSPRYETPPGADPSVPQELGGKGFDLVAHDLGFTTNLDAFHIGDPRAEKGGTIRFGIPEFPTTLRMEGKDSNSYDISMIGSLVYESLLGMDGTTLKHTPGLATHWKVSEDKMTFWYRIDPAARWSDGMPVTSDDIIASWKLRCDSGILAPYTNILYKKFEEPVAESKYIVRVRCNELSWRFFNYFSWMEIMPAHILNGFSGETYRKEYQYTVIPGTGPYTIFPDDIRKRTSITLTRREDYWGDSLPSNEGLYNYDRIKLVVVKNERLRLEKFKKGELDFYEVNRASWWVHEFNFDAVERGLIQKRRVYTDDPQGIGGFALNMRKPPFDDPRVRSAFSHLYNREKLIDKLFYNQYLHIDSYYPGSVYENPDNPVYRYDPELAMDLLAEAEWTETDDEGWLIKDGEKFELTMAISPPTERYLTVFQEDLAGVGIKLNLKHSDGTSRFKMVNERNFTIHPMGWTGTLFPNPESSFHSRTADPKNTTNITGVKDARIDSLCEIYNLTFDPDERTPLIREIDGILMELKPYVMSWYGPSSRIVYWNKFGHPECYFSKLGDWRGILQFWWVDQGKYDALKQAREDETMMLHSGEPGTNNELPDVRYWEKWKESGGVVAAGP